MRLQICRLSSVLCLLALIGCQPVQVKAQEEQAEEVIFGSKEFQKHCAACHGPEGKGDGPVAQSLKNPPPDLTLLSKQHDGRFPLDYVFKVIDGREMLSGHGTREMPIWGMRYSEELAEGDFVKELARGRTLSLFIVGVHEDIEALIRARVLFVPVSLILFTISKASNNNFWAKVLLTAAILQEILQGAADGQQFARYRSYFETSLSGLAFPSGRVYLTENGGYPGRVD
jgi:hypothetical protein